MLDLNFIEFGDSLCKVSIIIVFNSEGTEKTAAVTEKRERQPFPKRPLNPNVRWHLICVDMDDWEGLAELLKDSKVKCERDLYKCIVEDFLPAIPDIIEARVSQRPLFSDIGESTHTSCTHYLYVAIWSVCWKNWL